MMRKLLLHAYVDTALVFVDGAVEMATAAINWGRVNPVKFSLFFLLLPSVIGWPLIVLL